MSYKKYTKAESLATDKTLTIPADALYIGHGYATNDVGSGQLGSPSMWWKADDGIGLDRHGLGLVSTWEDAVVGMQLIDNRLGLNIDNTSKGPLFVEGDSGSNYKPYLSFNQSEKSFLKSGPAAIFDQGTGDFTVIIFARLDDATANKILLAKDYNSSEWALRTTLSGTFIGTVAGADAETDTVLSDDVWYCLEWSHNGTLNISQMYVNGVADGDPASAALDFDDDEYFMVGCRNDPSEQYLDGDIAEILYYNDRTLSSTTRAFVNSYFDQKYRASTHAKVTYFATTEDVNASPAIYTETENLEIGKIHQIPVTRIAGGTSTNATDIVALYEE